MSQLLTTKLGALLLLFGGVLAIEVQVSWHNIYRDHLLAWSAS